jgi:hypothetical protein
MREGLQKGIRLARLQMLLAPRPVVGKGYCRLPAEEPPGKFVMGAASLATEIPLDFGPEVRGRNTGVEKHKTPIEYPMTYRMWHCPGRSARSSLSIFTTPIPSR